MNAEKIRELYTNTQKDRCTYVDSVMEKIIHEIDQHIEKNIAEGLKGTLLSPQEIESFNTLKIDTSYHDEIFKRCISHYQSIGLISGMLGSFLVLKWDHFSKDV